MPANGILAVDEWVEARGEVVNVQSGGVEPSVETLDQDVNEGFTSHE